jgi:hypothetical protein
VPEIDFAAYLGELHLSFFQDFEDFAAHQRFVYLMKVL